MIRDRNRISEEKFDRELIWAIGVVKKACAFANFKLGFLERKKAQAILDACDEIIEGDFYKEILIDPLIGGADVLLNTEINKLIAEKANKLLEGSKEVDPLEDVNLHQSSTNVFLTSFKLVVLKLLREVSQGLASLQGALQQKEEKYKNIIKLGRISIRDVCPVTVGQEFSSWAEVVNRDWRRVIKAMEQVRVVNLGAGIVGTGLNSPEKFPIIAIEKLREYTGLPLAKADNMFEATQNLDSICEVSSTLKIIATNFIKIASDFKLLASGPKGGIGEFILPLVEDLSILSEPKPILIDTLIQGGIRLIGVDNSINLACSLGNLEFNPFLSFIAHEMVRSLKLLINLCKIFTNLVLGIKINEKRCRELLEKSGCVILAFIPYLGYEICEEIYEEVLRDEKKVEEVLVERGYFTEEEIRKILEISEITSFGFAGIKTLKSLIIDQQKTRR